MRRWPFVLVLVNAVAALLLLWAVWIEPGQLVVREVELTVPGWPSTELRLALLTDLHVGSPRHGRAALRRIVATVNEARPDAVLFLGDLVIHGVPGGRFVPPESAAIDLAAIHAPYGAWGVLGNHDWWLDGPRVARALEGAGLRVLEDTAAPLGTPGGAVWLAGVSDFWERPHDIAAALRAVPDDAAVILFTHNPDIFPDVPARVSVTIAGHTHGGQVRLPLVGRPIVPSRYGQRYAAGHVVEGGRHLFVTTGTGTSVLPVRFRVPPEIVILTLRRDGS